MARKKKEKKIKPELDTETTFADMNVEGFSWYDPTLKNEKKQPVPQLTKKEQRALIKGAYKAMLPMLLCVLTGFALMFLLAYFWLM